MSAEYSDSSSETYVTHAELSDEEADAIASKAKRRGLFIGIGVLVLVLVGLLIWNRPSKDPVVEAAQETATSVTVIRPGQQTIMRDITASGQLAARYEVPVGVVGEGGRVVQVLAEEGNWVKKGAPLIILDRSVQNQQLEASQAQIAVARADLNLAQNELNRALALVDRGFISKADVDRKRATRDGAAARVRAAEASVGELRARNARLTVYAPVSGLVLSRNVEVGQVVTGGPTALFSIAQGGEMEMMAQLSEEDLANISVGVIAMVTPVGSAEPIQGQVWKMSPLIDSNSRQGTARIALPYAEKLRPGGFANAVMRAGAITAPMLPESAVLDDKGKSYVYIVGKDSRAEKRYVKTGLVTDNGIAVLDGIMGSEQVVLRAGGFLNEGEKLAPTLTKNKDEV